MFAFLAKLLLVVGFPVLKSRVRLLRLKTWFCVSR